MTVTPERWGVIDEESIQEARELLGIPLRRDRMQWNDYATQDAIRQFADGVGDKIRFGGFGLRIEDPLG